MANNAKIRELLYPLKSCQNGTSLMVQWLRLCLRIQRVGVRTLVRELRSICLEAKKPKCETKATLTNSIKTLNNGGKKKQNCQVTEFQEGDITFNLEHKEKIYEGGDICPRLLEVD